MFHVPRILSPERVGVVPNWQVRLRRRRWNFRRLYEIWLFARLNIVSNEASYALCREFEKKFFRTHSYLKSLLHDRNGLFIAWFFILRKAFTNLGYILLCDLFVKQNTILYSSFTVYCKLSHVKTHFIFSLSFATAFAYVCNILKKYSSSCYLMSRNVNCSTTH